MVGFVERRQERERNKKDMNGMNKPNMKGENKILFNPFGFLIE